jgi:hypothetical protein
MHGRRTFVVLTGLAGAGLLGSSGCDRKPSAEAEPDAEPAATPESLEPAPTQLTPEPNPPSLVDSYEPRLDRIHSAAIYELVVSKSAAVEIAEQRARAATVEARQDIVERDLFDDDYYEREDGLVLLGERDGWLIGFCYRYLVDFRFPVAGNDGIGAAEYEDPQLTVLGQTFPLTPIESESERSPDRAEGDYAWYRTFGDHDAALVYLPMTAAAGEVAHLGFEDPLAVVRHTLDNSSSIFGLEFVLMSRASLKFIQAQTREDQIAAFAAGMAVAALILIPLLGPSPAALPMALLEGSGRKLVAQALPLALVLGRELVLRDDGFATNPGEDEPGEEKRVDLLGVEFPLAGSEGHQLLGKFLASVIDAPGGSADGSAQFVAFGQQQEAARGQVFLPSHKMHLGAELLSRGIVRLDMDDQDVLREFPELVTAALSAVESKQALAGRWADEDAEYVTQLRTLNKVVAG